MNALYLGVIGISNQYSTICVLIALTIVVCPPVHANATPAHANAGSPSRVLYIPIIEQCAPGHWKKGEKAVLAELKILFDEVKEGYSSQPNCRMQDFAAVLSQNANHAVVYLGSISDEKPALHLWLWENGGHKYQSFSLFKWKNAGALSFAILNMSEQISVGRHLRTVENGQTNRIPRPTTPSAPSVAVPLSPAKSHMVFCGLGGGVFAIPDFGSVGHLSMHITWEPLRVASFTMRAAGSLSHPEISFEDRSIFTQLFVLQGWFNLDFANRTRVTPTLGIGGGGVLAKMKGGAVSDEEYSRTDKTSVAYAGAKASFRLRLKKLISLNGGIQVGRQLPAIEVVIPNQSNTKLNPFIVEGFLSLDVLLRRNGMSAK